MKISLIYLYNIYELHYKSSISEKVNIISSGKQH